MSDTRSFAQLERLEPREKMCGGTPARIGHSYWGVPPWFLPRPGQRCYCGEQTWPARKENDGRDA